MHSETLRACGIVVESVLHEERNYFLARAKRGERRIVVEITPAGAGYIHSWPSSPHLVPPMEARNLPGELRLLVFETGTARFLCEDLHDRPFNPGEASEIIARAADALAGLQASGLIAGYVGPENMLRESDGRVIVLAGRRGLPSNPFTPPETVGRRPSDPRSDVFSLGTLYLRLIAGNDDRETLVEAWNHLDSAAIRNLSSLLEQDPMQRPSGVIQAAKLLAPLQVPDQPAAAGAVIRQPAFKRENSAGAARKGRKRQKPALFKLIIPGCILVLLVVLLMILHPWSGRDRAETEDTGTEFQTVPPDSSISAAPDSLPPAVDSTETSPDDNAVIWVSNGTDTDGRETEFRAGPASAYSFVYPARGVTRRRTSLVLVRRESPETSLTGSVFYPAAQRFASLDSSMTVRPTDVTILLGTDLYHPGLNQSRLSTPTGPLDTLFIDIANHGIQYTLEGMGAASWMASKLSGKAITIDGVQWVLSVSDIRDGDRQSDEIGIPANLENTMFIYRPGSTCGPQLEEALRGVFQALPAAVQGPASGVPVPDIHVLLGSP